MKSAKYSELQRKNEKDKTAEEGKSRLLPDASFSDKEMTTSKSELQVAF